MMTKASLFLAAVLAATEAAPQVVDITNDGIHPGEQRFIEVSNPRFVLIELSTGQRVGLEFDLIYDRSASYRWRYQSSANAEIMAGEGRVVDSYERVEVTPNEFRLVRRAEHDPIVRAGPIRLLWSPGGTGKCFLYYHPRLAKISTHYTSTVDGLLEGPRPYERLLVVQVVDRFFEPVGPREGLRVVVRSEGPSADLLRQESPTDDNGFTRFAAPSGLTLGNDEQYRIEVSGQHPSGKPLRVRKKLTLPGGHWPQYYQIRVKLEYRRWWGPGFPD
jgi:hypothetical protein